MNMKQLLHTKENLHSLQLFPREMHTCYVIDSWLILLKWMNNKNVLLYVHSRHLHNSCLQ